MARYSNRYQANRYLPRSGPAERDPRACEVCGVHASCITYDTAAGWSKPHRVCALHADLTMDRRVAAREVRNA